MDQIAAAAAGPQGMPGTDEYVAWRLGKAQPPETANEVVAPRVAAKPVPEKSPATNSVITNPATSKPAPAGSPAANDNRPATPRPIGRHAPATPASSGSEPRIVNGRVAGMAEAATRPGITMADFLQAADDYIRLGAVGVTGGYADDASAGLNAFFDMLGGENLAEAFAARQAEERQRTEAARERRGTTGAIVAAAPTFLPGVGDAAGLLADFRDYLENGDQWTAADWALVAAGLVPGMPNRRTVKTGQKIIDDTLELSHNRKSLLAQIEQSKAKVFTVSEANRLGGDHKGLIYVAEALPKNKRAREHQSGTDGAFSDVRTKKFASAALRFVNPNKRGRNFIKFEVSGVSDDGNFIELADAKTKLAIWSRGPQQTTPRTLERTKEALIQNPGYRVVYEFDDTVSEQKARRFIQKHNYHHYIRTRMRKR
jgi:hypothetical protein